MPVREASVAPIHVGGCSLISLRCVGLVSNDAARWRHKVSSTWTGVDRFIRRPFAVLSACWRWVNIPAAPAMVGLVLRRVPSSLCQRRQEHRLALGGGGVDQGEESALAIIWEGEDLLDGVNRPSEDNFMHAPSGIAFAELLEEDWFFPCSVVLVVGLEDVFDGAKEMSCHLPSSSWLSLDYTDEVI